MKKGGKRERNEEGSSRGGKELPVPLTQSYTHFQHRQTQTHTHTNLHTDGIIRHPELLNTTLHTDKNTTYQFLYLIQI